jgi:hypothetical protein
MKTQSIVAAALVMLAGAAVAQESKPAAPEAATDEHVVPYCIEPMESMPDNIRALIDAQFRCAAGTHLKRDSRPVWVVPSGEEALGRPFVLRFKPPEKANAWYVRGFTTQSH